MGLGGAAHMLDVRGNAGQFASILAWLGGGMPVTTGQRLRTGSERLEHPPAQARCCSAMAEWP